MGIKYIDADDVEHDLEEEAGAGGTTRPVHGIASSIGSTFTSIKAAVEAVAALISASKLAVSDAVAATKLDTLHTDLGTTVHGDLLAIDGHVDGLEATMASILTGVGTTLHADLDGVEGKLDTLHTDLGTTLHADLLAIDGHVDAVETKLDALTPNSAGPYYGQSTVGTTATQLSSQALKAGVRVKNLHATQDLYVGGNNSLTNSNGHKLRPGEETPVPCANLNQIWLYGSAASTSYSYLAS